jgi:type I restriction enzyme M protein
MDTFLSFEETEQSKIFQNAALGYWKITVERPLRLKVELSASTLNSFKKACTEANDEPLSHLADRLASTLGQGPHTDFNIFMTEVDKDAERHGIKINAKRQKLLQTALAEKDESAKPVIKKLHKPGKIEADPLHGFYLFTLEGKPFVVEYETDSDLRDTEQVQLLEEGGIEAFFSREVLPYVSDAWIEEKATKIGYEISFTRYFYKPQPLRTLEEIRADITAVEMEAEGILDEIILGGEKK